MTSGRKGRGRPKKDKPEGELENGRASIAIDREVHNRLTEFAKGSFGIQQAATDMIAFCLEQPAGFAVAVMLRRILPGSDAELNRAFCDVLTKFRDRVCAKCENGKRSLLLDDSENTTAASAR